MSSLPTPMPAPSQVPVEPGSTATSHGRDKNVGSNHRAPGWGFSREVACPDPSPGPGLPTHLGPCSHCWVSPTPPRGSQDPQEEGDVSTAPVIMTDS